MDRSDLEPVAGQAVTQPTRPTVVVAMPLREAARDRLAERLAATVVDIRTPVDHPDLVLTPACSPQLLSALKRRFAGAAVVVVEVSDWDLGVDVRGPVKRILAAGADAYLLADSIDDLAAKLSGARATADAVPWRPHELVGPTMDDLLAAFLEESVSYAQRRRHAHHADG